MKSKKKVEKKLSGESLVLDDDTTEKSNANTKFIGHEKKNLDSAKPKRKETNVQTDEINMITAKYLKFSDFLEYQLKMYQA